MRVLIVEDEKDLANVLSEMLELEGYHTDIANDGEYGLDCAMTGIYDLIILDIMLPKLDGIAVLRKLRQKQISSAVLMLTAKSQIEDKVDGLDSGADDYLTKPFVSKEFLARVRALCRRRPLEYLSSALSFSDISLDSARHELQCGERRVNLSQKEYDMMEMLLLNHGQIIPKESFLTKIWGYDSNAEYNSIEVYVSFLRKKLTALHSGVKIKIVRGVGYYLEGASDAAGN